MKAGDVVLVDTNVIIEGYLRHCWGALAGAYRVQTVEKCVIEAMAGRHEWQQTRPSEADLRKTFDEIHAVDRGELAKVLVSGGAVLDEGEQHLWAHALARNDAWILCGPDRASMRFGYEQQQRERPPPPPRIIHATLYLAEILASGRAENAMGVMLGGAEGRVYASTDQKAIQKSVQKGADLIEFTGQAAQFFDPHPAPLWSIWGMLKRYLGKQWRTSRAADLVIVSGHPVPDGYVVTLARLKHHTGLRLLWSQFRLAGRILVIEPLAMIITLSVYLYYGLHHYPTFAEFMLGMLWVIVPLWGPAFLWLGYRHFRRGLAWSRAQLPKSTPIPRRRERSTSLSRSRQVGFRWIKVGSYWFAYTIVGTATDLESTLQQEVIKFSASGFRDFTRIAASDLTMWRDVFLNNREAVLDVLQRFTEDLTALQRAIRRSIIDAKQA